MIKLENVRSVTSDMLPNVWSTLFIALIIIGLICLISSVVTVKFMIPSVKLKTLIISGTLGLLILITFFMFINIRINTQAKTNGKQFDMTLKSKVNHVEDIGKDKKRKQRLQRLHLDGKEGKYYVSIPGKTPVSEGDDVTLKGHDIISTQSPRTIKDFSKLPYGQTLNVDIKHQGKHYQVNSKKIKLSQIICI